MKYIPVLEETQLTTDYIEAGPFPLSGANQLMLYVKYVAGNSLGVELCIEFSPTGLTYYEETSVLALLGEMNVSTNRRMFSAGGNYRLPIPVSDGYFRIFVRGRGADLTSSSIQIEGTLESVGGEFY